MDVRHVGTEDSLLPGGVLFWLWPPVHDATNGAVGKAVLDILVRNEHGAHAMRTDPVPDGGIREPLPRQSQCCGRLRSDASTDLCRSLVADVLLPRPASEENCFHRL